MESPGARMQSLGRSVLARAARAERRRGPRRASTPSTGTTSWPPCARYYDPATWSTVCIGPHPEPFRAVAQDFDWEERDHDRRPRDRRRRQDGRAQRPDHRGAGRPAAGRRSSTRTRATGERRRGSRTSAGALALTSPAAALEFSVPGAVFENSAVLLEAGVPTVVGATGLTDAAGRRPLRQGGGLRRRPRRRPQLRARRRAAHAFAAEAARHYEHAEIIETARDGQGRRAVGHLAAHGAAHGRGAGVRPGGPARRRADVPRPRRRRPRDHPQRAPARRSWRTRRSCSAARTRSSPCATTRSPGARSCRACCWRCARRRRCGAPSSASRTSSTSDRPDEPATAHRGKRR